MHADIIERCLYGTYTASSEGPVKLYLYVRSPALQLSVTLKSVQ